MQTTPLKELPDVNNQIRLALALYIVQVSICKDYC